MVKFEYAQVLLERNSKVSKVKVKVTVYGFDGKIYQNVMDALNAAGQDGWELVTVEKLGDEDSDLGLTSYLMKRPILNN